MKKHLFKLERIDYTNSSSFYIVAEYILNVYDSLKPKYNLKYTYNKTTGILEVYGDEKIVYVETNVTILDIRKKKLDSL